MYQHELVNVPVLLEGIHGTSVSLCGLVKVDTGGMEEDLC